MRTVLSCVSDDNFEWIHLFSGVASSRDSSGGFDGEGGGVLGAMGGGDRLYTTCLAHTASPNTMSSTRSLAYL